MGHNLGLRSSEIAGATSTSGLEETLLIDICSSEAEISAGPHFPRWAFLGPTNESPTPALVLPPDSTGFCSAGSDLGAHSCVGVVRLCHQQHCFCLCSALLVQAFTSSFEGL